MKQTKDTGLIHSRILDLTKDENLTLEKADEFLGYLSDYDVEIRNRRKHISALELQIETLKHKPSELEKSMRRHQLYKIDSAFWANGYTHALLYDYITLTELMREDELTYTMAQLLENSIDENTLRIALNILITWGEQGVAFNS
jgi:hypothetical protein